MAQAAAAEERVMSIALSLNLMASLTFNSNCWSLSSAQLSKQASQALVYAVGLDWPDRDAPLAFTDVAAPVDVHC